ncbi:hypothetical protein ACFE04_023644 [Oxalis oulophora]
MKLSLHKTNPISLSSTKLNRLLQQCSNSKSVNQGKQVHQQILIHGSSLDSFMITKLIQMYADCDELPSARYLFDKLPQQNVFAWTAFFSFYARHGMFEECVKNYGSMKKIGSFPDCYVFPKVLKACGQMLVLDVGVQVHKDVIVCGCDFNVQVCNPIIDMYAKCGDIESSRRIFDEMAERDLFSWNSMISGYVSNGNYRLAVELFNMMGVNGFQPDIVTLNTVMDAYCRMELCAEASKIFEQIEEPNIISWTTLISGYSRAGQHQMSLKIFREMVNNGVKPDLNSLSSVIVSCRFLGALSSGKEIHSYGVKMENGTSFYNAVGAALLIVYAKQGEIENARKIFDLMDKSDVVTWNAMIVGYVDSGTDHLAFKCFIDMARKGVNRDQTTIATILPHSDLKQGKQIHAFISTSHLYSSIPIWNALIHMYSKSGCVKSAYSVFSNMESRDLVSWNTMIRGFGMHGLADAALQLLQRMKKTGICPNSFTFTSALSACSHSGLVNEGVHIFETITEEFGITPRMEHFACVVDILARAGRIEEAVSFIQKMPIEPNKRIWGALLAASRDHGNIDVANLAAEKLSMLEPEHAGHYVTLSNIYARAGRWDDAVGVRKEIDSRGLMKPSGQSWI